MKRENNVHIFDDTLGENGLWIYVDINERQTDLIVDIQTDRHIGRYIDRQIYRQRQRWVEILTDI